MGSAEEGIKQWVAPPLPEIYKLISAEAGSEAIVQQLYRDLHAGSLVNERLFLGFQELLNRGFEGEGALRFVASGSDELSEVAKKILATPKRSSEQLEQMLGIRRWGDIQEVKNAVDLLEAMKLAYAHAKAKGHTSASFEETLNEAKSTAGVPIRTADDVRTRTEGSLYAFASSFGGTEATYLELIEPREILRLRSLPNANMLLLGSLGPQSAREFSRYAKKIQPAIRPFVIDINEKVTEVTAEDPGVDRRNLVVGDARELPFADGSMEHVYTNDLFHYLHKDKGEDEEFERSIRNIFKEATRVLKPGGSFVVSEQSYGAYKRSQNIKAASDEIRRIASQAGFKTAKELGWNYIYFLVAEVSSAKIDELGFPHYEDTFMLRRPNDEFRARFVKN